MAWVQLVRRFVQRGGAAYNIGERITVDDALADSLCAAGIAVRLAYEAPPIHRMIDTAPIKKDLLHRKGRLHEQQ